MKKFNKFLSAALALIMALSAMTAGITAVSAAQMSGETAAAGAVHEMTVPKKMIAGDVWEFDAAGSYPNISSAKFTVETGGVITAVQTDKHLKVTAMKPGTAKITMEVSTWGYDSGGSYDTVKDIIYYNITVTSNVPKPAAPTNVRLANVADGIQVSWTKAANAEKYRVFYKTAAVTYWSWVDTSEASCRINYLYPGVLYYFQVQSINSEGELCGISKAVSMTYIPGTNLYSISYNSNASVTLTWTKAEGANGYQIAKKKPGDSAYTYLTTTATSYNDKSVQCGTIYYYQIRPYYTTGKSTAYAAWSNTKSITTLYRPTITNINGTAARMNINWNKIMGVSKYKLAFKRASDSAWNYRETTANYYNVANPTPNVTYYVQVCPMNGSIAGQYSPAATFILKSSSLGKTTLTAAFKGARIDLNWTAVPGAVNYEIAKKSYTDKSYTYYTTFGTGFSDYDFESGSTYYYQVRAFDGTNYGPWSSVAVAPTLTAPSIYSLHENGNYIDMGWYPVTGAMQYRVAYKKASDSGWSYSNEQYELYSIYKPSSNTTYYIQICAIGQGNAQGPWSKVYSIKTAAG